MVLRIPAADRVVVVLVQQEPLLLVEGRSGGRSAPARTGREPLAEQVEVQLARAHRLCWVLGLVRSPRPAVPDDDVATAVLAGRDDALEGSVLHGVVLDVDGEAAYVGSRVGPLGTAQLTSTPSISRRKS